MHQFIRQAIILLLFSGCFQTLLGQAVPRQGIAGCVYVQRGNRMPMKGRAPRLPGKPVAAEVYIYAPLRLSEVMHLGLTIQTIKVTPIKVIATDSTGCFSVDLLEGNYSVLVKWQGQWYAERVNSLGYINFVEITKNQALHRNFIIRKGATY